MAAIKIKYSMDVSQVKLGLEALGKEAPRASMRAINRTLQSVQTQSVRSIAADLGVIQRVVRETMRIYRATTTSLRGSLQATGKRIALIDFRAKGKEPSRGRGGGVTYRMQGQAKTVKGAFIATMRSGHRGVFFRKGTSGKKSVGAWSRNLPIVELKGPSVPHVFRKHITSALRTYAGTELQKNLNHEVAYLLLRK
jgi:hypothetical protein